MCRGCVPNRWLPKASPADARSKTIAGPLDAGRIQFAETSMAQAYICDFARTPIGRYAGALKDVRADDLAAHPIRVLRERHPGVDWEAVDDVVFDCAASQAGEDNRDVARMAALLAGPPLRNRRSAQAVSLGEDAGLFLRRLELGSNLRRCAGAAMKNLCHNISSASRLRITS
jgi:hypothetical protein